MHCVFVSLDKAYNRAMREELWSCMWGSGVAKKSVRLVQDMYEISCEVLCRSDKWLQAGGETASRTCLESLFVCNGDGQTDR